MLTWMISSCNNNIGNESIKIFITLTTKLVIVEDNCIINTYRYINYKDCRLVVVILITFT